MLLKPRSESEEMLIRRSLCWRDDTLTSRDRFLYGIILKGYLGELKFDALLEPRHGNWLILNDLILTVNGKETQIDTMLIGSTTIYHINVKDYEGIYYVENNMFCSDKSKEQKDLIGQLERCNNLIRNLLHELNYQQFSVVPYIVFVNPKLTLYQAPRDLPMILPSQLDGFIDRLYQQGKDMNITLSHRKLADEIISRCQSRSAYSKIPGYTLDGLKKGVFCVECGGNMVHGRRGAVNCTKCGHKEKIEMCVVRNVEEFRLLFPDLNVTVPIIVDWCAVIPEKSIRKTLIKHYKRIGKGRSTEYVVFA